MTSSSAVQLYLSANLLLLVGYLLFTALRRLTRVVRLNASHHQWMRVGQLLMVSSVCLPLLFHFIPRQHLPAVEWAHFQPFSEGKEMGMDPERGNRSAKDPSFAKTRAEPFDVGSPRDIDASSWFLFLVLLGNGLFSARFLLNARKLCLMLDESTPIRSLGQVRIVIADTATIPFSARLWRKNWVVVPARMLTSGNDFRIAIRHELQHHRQGDTYWAVFVELLMGFFFPNPAVYLWKRDLVELQEFSCDEALIGRERISAHEYGSCLVRVAEAALGSRQMHAGTTCMATVSKNPVYFKSFLRRRVEMFMTQKRPRTRREVGMIIGTLSMGFLVALAFGAEQAVNPGSVVVDPTVQKIAESALREAIEAQKAKGGFAIVAEPSTGRILAVANVDLTRKLSGHWALGQVLEPASFAKTLVAAQAIENRLTTPQESHSCENGSYRYGSRVYHDWKKAGWDRLTTEDTIAFSGDICSIKIGERIGAAGLRNMLVHFGFGPEGSAKSFPEAKTGVLPPQASSANAELVPAVTAGYGFHATPLELLQAYGAIANGGKLMAPKPANSKTGDGQVLRQVLSPETAEKMKGILRQVVLKGTAKGHAESALYSIAGKTATSYVPDLTKWDLLEGKKKGNFAGFIGFAPLKEPRVEVYVGIRDPHTDETGAHGSVHAAPVVKRIAEEVLKEMKVAPDLPRS